MDHITNMHPYEFPKTCKPPIGFWELTIQHRIAIDIVARGLSIPRDKQIANDKEASRPETRTNRI